MSLWERFRRRSDDEPLVVSARVVGRGNVRDEDYLTLEGEDLIEKDFSGRKLEGLSVADSRFSRCRFERMRVADVSFGAGLQISRYTDCSFDGSRFQGTTWGQARFERCSFRDVRLTGLFGFDAEFVDCVFTGRAESCVFNGRPITGVQDTQALADHLADLLDPAERAAMQDRIDHAPPDRDVNEFSGNDFTDMELIDVAFRGGIDLTKQRFPDDSRYVIVTDAQAAIAQARAQVRFWEDDADREFALGILRDLTRDCEEGQAQLYLCAADWDANETQRALYELLRSGPT